MSLKKYFSDLLAKIEASDDITNAGKDSNGLYKPKRTILLRHVQLLLDLHEKPLARPLVKKSWEAVCQEIPAEWLVLRPEEREELRKILG